VVEEGGFTRAAERVHVSQSGVSAQVRQLERELGQVLLDRTTRRVALTPAGAAVLPHARAALTAVAALRRAADDLGGLVTGQVAVGMVTGCALPGLFEGLAAFTRAHPNVRLSLTEGASDEMTRAVRAGDLDLAVVGAFGPPLPGTERVVVVDEPVVLATAPDGPLTGDGPVALRDLSGVPLVGLPRGAGVRAAFDAACAAAGADLAVGLEASSPDAVAEMAAQGLAVAVLSESMAAARPDLRTVPLAPPVPRSRLEAVWRSGPAVGAAARVLAGCVRAALEPPARRPDQGPSARRHPRGPC